jgi:hypothetical protein
MSTSARNRLFDLDVDEVSSVDRPANQLGLIAIAKALHPQEDGMSEQTDTLFEIPEGVEHGDTVTTPDGQEFVYLEVDDAGDPLPLEGLDVGELISNAETVYDVGADVDEPEPAEAPVGKADLGLLRSASAAGRRLPGQVKEFVQKNPKKAAAIGGAAAGAGVAGGGAYMVAQKSLGTQVLEELSKAVTSEERDKIVAKMADEVELTKAENDELRKAFEEERDIRITEAFVAKAAEYELPVPAETFGPILKAIAEVLDDSQLEVLDTVLSSRGVPMDELGYAGGASNSGVLDEVSGLAAELVGKAAGSVSTEQAMTALFEHNPGAYEQYLAEQDGR